jgi:hypothetical protein
MGSNLLILWMGINRNTKGAFGKERSYVTDMKRKRDGYVKKRKEKKNGQTKQTCGCTDWPT